MNVILFDKQRHSWNDGSQTKSFMHDPQQPFYVWPTATISKLQGYLKIDNLMKFSFLEIFFVYFNSDLVQPMLVILLLVKSKRMLLICHVYNFIVKQNNMYPVKLLWSNKISSQSF